MKMINVVLSGGVGSRLWPISRKTDPKQYLPLFGNKSLFELTVERNQEVCDEVMVIGGIDNFQLSRSVFSKLDIVNYGEIVEANPRNTAAAIAFAAFEANPEEILLVTPSDHLIENDRSYYKAIDEAKGLALEDQLVAFGLLPTKPETGYGYIEHIGREVISFREKPDLETAKEFIKSKKFLWNSGMFCFRAGIYLEELKTHEPDVYRFAKRAHEKKSGSFINEILSDLIPNISVDYAVMEKTEKIKVIPSSFGWSDMGSLQDIYDYIPDNDSRKRFSNLYIGTDKQVDFVGVENVILVETEDAIMVLNKENSQDVKKIYKRLESENPALLR